ncbi:U11/U12 small nuclear ribonucleoprotein 35 kDa protein-like [Sitodiplosis mosellana]|uniref:U11/U12 small nuclear ribonucleoprotein 35 kDa protein-like n=1 Tax=Sitodiplosis mosellana TaxID=263140 RepID=UPI002443B30E|nr:U11/U12 small nuclear ribonucleoprotein 35 kDa protein-like [Sitodiplosis mosellana]
MSEKKDSARDSAKDSIKWTKYAETYDPIRVGSIDGTDTYPHDNGIVRAIKSHYKPNERVVGNPKHTIFIGRLHLRTDEATIRHKFQRYGKIVNLRLVRDAVTAISKQYAFVEYESSSAVKDAIYDMDQRVIDNREIIVDQEHERRLEGWKPRRLGGGFGGKKESGQLRFGCKLRPFQRPYDTNKPMTSKGLKDVFRHQKYHK